ncbi:MAG: potassium channel family protein, partial [Candidatus Nitrotoga sp.]|nr:potassium channel family protein [Candidatus Nitrotoga sp.]
DQQWLYLRKFFPTDVAGVFLLSHPYSFRYIPQIVNTLLITSSLMYFAENEAQPEKFASIPDAIYWAVITLTTVGYGDFTPVTWPGRVISLFTAFLGVCTVAILTGIVASAFANQMARRRVIFETELRKAFADGMISPQEDQTLDQLGRAFNLSPEETERMINKVREELSKRQT